MMCQCKDENGNLLSRCNGTCGPTPKETIIIQKNQQERDLLNGLSEQFGLRVDRVMCAHMDRLQDYIEQCHKSAFMKGVKEGIREGIKIGIKIGKEY